MSDITQQMDKLEIPIKLSFPVINVSTFELGRAESVFSDIAKKVGKHFIVMPFKKLPDPGTMKAMVDESKKSSKNGVVVFDTFFFDRQRANPETLPALKSSLTYLENEGINYIIAGKDVFN
ncbi:ATPase, partial [Klebsiella pneumoniae]